MMRGERGRSSAALVAALAVHAALLLALARPGPPALRRAAHALGARFSLEIELEAQAATGANAPGPELASIAPRGRSRSVTPAPSESAPSEPNPGNEATPSLDGDPEPRASKPRALSDLGIGSSTALFDAPHSATPESPDAPSARIDRMLADELARRDRQKGIGSDGPVVSALERATYASGVPGNGSALFVVRVDSSGRLSVLDVIESSGDHGGWQAVARHAIGALGKRKLRVPAGSHGMEFRIRVSSREILPSGADPGVEVRLFHVPLQKGRGKRSSKIKILEPYAKIQEIEVPNPSGDSIKYPVPVFGLGVFGVEGDPSDVGAKPRRMVHATVESQSLL